jgi:hypothetical protein
MRPLSDRVQVEDREPEQAKRRALVVDYDTAKWLIGIILTCGGLVTGAAWYTATTVTDIDRRVTALETRTVQRDTEVNAINSRIATVEASVNDGRVSDASVASSLIFIRDAVTAIGGRLDRIENKVDARP